MTEIIPSEISYEKNDSGWFPWFNFEGLIADTKMFALGYNRFETRFL
jgi:hypothetical protein